MMVLIMAWVFGGLVWVMRPRRELVNASVLLDMLSKCPDLPNRRNIRAAGLLAGVPMSDGESVERARQRLEQGAFPGELEGSWDQDVVQWFLVLCRDETAYLVEVKFFAELLLDDQFHVRSTLTQDQADALRPHVRVWIE